MDFELIIKQAVSLADSPYALSVLFILAFTESSFFLIPPDVLLIPLAIANPAWALFYGFLTTSASVLGGMFGYWIGFVGGRPFLKKFTKREKIKIIQHYYRKYDVWAVAIAAFTPIPYKLFTISAGVFAINFARFVLASALGRGGRFFAISILIFLFGPAVKYFLENYFELAVLLFSLLLIGGFLVFGKIIPLLIQKAGVKQKG